MTTSITEIAAYWRRNNLVRTLKQTYLALEIRRNANIFYLFDGFIELFFLYFSVKMGKFQISKMFDKFLEKVAVKCSSPALVSDNSKITDFQEAEKLC